MQVGETPSWFLLPAHRARVDSGSSDGPGDLRRNHVLHKGFAPPEVPRFLLTSALSYLWATFRAAFDQEGGLNPCQIMEQEIF